MARLAIFILVAALGGCADIDPPHLRTLVNVVANQEGRAAEEATTRLVAEGRRALVVIEAALHTASAPGRRRLVRAIGRLGDVDGCALLGHLARYDEEPAVKEAARAVLQEWGADAKDPARAQAAGHALETIFSRPDLAGSR